MRVCRGIVVVMLLALVMAACSSEAPSVESLPEGNAESGAELFARSINGLPSCASCHSLDGTNRAGPTLEDYAARAGSQVPGETAAQYTYTSIIRPAAHLVDGYGNIMYNQYEQRLTSQQIADLIAYLLTL